MSIAQFTAEPFIFSSSFLPSPPKHDDENSIRSDLLVRGVVNKESLEIVHVLEVYATQPELVIHVWGARRPLESFPTCTHSPGAGYILTRYIISKRM